MMNIFNYRRLWKSQRNKNKILTKKINKMQSGYFEEFKDDEIERLKGQVENLEKRLLRVNYVYYHFPSRKVKYEAIYDGNTFREDLLDILKEME